MSEMVERVARAIAKENCADDWDKIDEHDVGDRGALLRRDYLALARAAIETMRDMTPGMIEAGTDRLSDPDPAAMVFCAMVDAALCGEPVPKA